MEARVLGAIDDIPERDWNTLWRPEDGPFVDHRFLAALEHSGAVQRRRGWIPHHIALYDDGKLVAAAPAYLKLNSEGEFVFDFAWAEAAERAGLAYYPKLILAVPFTPATGARLLVHPAFDRARALAFLPEVLRQLLGELEYLSSVHVLFPTEDFEQPFTAAGFDLRWGLQYQWHARGARSFEDFLGSLPSKRRTQIRRERRSVADQGFTLRTLAPAELDASLAETMHALYLTTVDKFAWGRRYLNAAFFAEIVERYPDPLRFVVAERAGTIVAGAINFAGHDALYGRYWGAFEEHPFLHFETCYYHGVDECIAQGLRRFEPGAGGEHKQPRGFAATKTRSLHLLRHPGLARAVGEFLDRERDAIDAHLQATNETPG